MQEYKPKDDQHEDTPYTLFGKNGLQPEDLGCPDRFLIDASRAGNVARWINHSHFNANVEARALSDALAPEIDDCSGWRIGLFATCDLAEGETLRWNYMYSAAEASHRRPALMTATHPLDSADYEPELMRNEDDDTPVRAEWFHEQGTRPLDWGGNHEARDHLLTQGYPPPADPPLLMEWVGGCQVDQDTEDAVEDAEDLAAHYSKHIVDAYDYLFPQSFAMDGTREFLPIPIWPWTQDDPDGCPPSPPAVSGDPERSAYWQRDWGLYRSA